RRLAEARLALQSRHPGTAGFVNQRTRASAGGRQMGELVFVAAVSHTAQMIRAADVLSETQRRDIYGAWQILNTRLEASRPDALIVAASEHFKTFHLDNMPAFSIGLGDRTRAWGEGGVPKYEIPLHGSLADTLLDGLLEAGFDVAYSRDMPLDH